MVAVNALRCRSVSLQLVFEAPHLSRTVTLPHYVVKGAKYDCGLFVQLDADRVHKCIVILSEDKISGKVTTTTN